MRLFNILLIISVCCTISCNDYLDVNDPIGALPENFYQSEEDAIAAVNAAYASLQWELGEDAHFRWFWGDIMSDDAVKGGSGDNDGVEIGKLENFIGENNTSQLRSEWSSDYSAIYRANLVLNYVPGIEMDEDLKKRILAEARFLRGHFYYTLVTMFGGVPIVDRLITISESYDINRSSAEDCWAFIEADFRAAAMDLPLRSQYGAGEVARASKGAAQAYLLKTLLWRKNFVEAQQVGLEIVSSGEYSLAPDYASIFTTAGEHGPGSVFEISYMNASGGNWPGDWNSWKEYANEGTFTNVFQRPRGLFGGYGFNLPTEDFVQEFIGNFEDPRLKHTVIRIGDQVGDWGVLTEDNTGFPHLYYAKKYVNNQNELAPFGDPNPNGGSNDRVIRYADVLLMHAEAAAQNGDYTAARESINAVRQRVNLSNVSASDANLLNAIYKERRLELGLEGHRFFDLVRTGRAQEVLGPLGYVEGVHNVFPIPQQEIDLSNGLYQQNPGY